MTIMLYKKNDGKSPSMVKYKGVGYDYIVVPEDGVEKANEQGYFDIGEETEEKDSDEPVDKEVEEAKDKDGDGLVDKSDKEEMLRDVYEEIAGKKPDGRWSEDRLRQEIDALKV